MMSALHHRQNQLQAIFRLPPEVLRIIFRYSAPVADSMGRYNRPARPSIHFHRLSLVCKDWQQILINDHSFWTAIHNISIPEVQEMLRRSKGALLDIFIQNYQAVTNCRDESLQMIAMNKDRIRKLHVSNSPDSHAYFFSLHFPNLTSCYVSSYSSINPDDFLGLETPHLRDLIIRLSDFDWDSMTRRRVCCPEPGALGSGRCTAGYHRYMGEMFGALERMPLLNTLLLGCTDRFPIGDAASSTSGSISLDHLKLLGLSGTLCDVQRVLLSGIRIPPAPQSTVDITLHENDEDEPWDPQGFLDAAAWLTHHLTPASEAGEIDRVVWNTTYGLDVHAAPKTDGRASPLLRLHLPPGDWDVDSFYAWLLRHLPLEGIQTFELALPYRSSAFVFDRIRQHLERCRRLAKWEILGYTQRELMWCLGPARHGGVPAPTLRHLSVVGADLLDDDGRQPPPIDALRDALIRRRAALGVALPVSITRSTIDEGAVRALRDVVGESQFEWDGRYGIYL
jgi:hypothetical protein